MKCLVTGGAGFIGSNLVDKLVELGYEVSVIDNESATAHDKFYYNNKSKYYKYDICDYVNTRPLYNNVDYVFHLAAESRIQPTLDNPLLAVQTNTLGTATVLQCARESGVKRVIYSSTSSAYGRNIPPLQETMRDDCLNPYSVSKVAGEKLCTMYSELFELDTVIFRYFNVYGQREPIKGPYAPVVGLFLRQKRAGESLTVVGDGLQTRDFTHVDDVVRANIQAMTHGKIGQVHNIGTGKNNSVLDLAKLISNDLTFITQRLGEARDTQADISYTEASLNWKAEKSILDYIKEQVNE